MHLMKVVLLLGGSLLEGCTPSPLLGKEPQAGLASLLCSCPNQPSLLLLVG